MLLDIHGEPTEVEILDSMISGFIEVEIGNEIFLMDEHSTPAKIKEELEEFVNSTTGEVEYE